MLKKHFFAWKGPRMYEIEGALGNCKHKCDLVMDYFGKLTKMMHDLENYEKALDYCCIGLTCKWIAEGEQQCKEKMLHKLLLGSYHSFCTIISQILIMNLLPSIDNVYNMVIREERHCVIAFDSGGSSKGLG